MNRIDSCHRSTRERKKLGDADTSSRTRASRRSEFLNPRLSMSKRFCPFMARDLRLEASSTILIKYTASSAFGGLVGRKNRDSVRHNPRCLKRPRTCSKGICNGPDWLGKNRPKSEATGNMTSSSARSGSGESRSVVATLSMNSSISATGINVFAPWNSRAPMFGSLANEDGRIRARHSAYDRSRASAPTPIFKCRTYTAHGLLESCWSLSRGCRFVLLAVASTCRKSRGEALRQKPLLTRRNVANVLRLTISSGYRR
jgi:hypothetical protein